MSETPPESGLRTLVDAPHPDLVGQCLHDRYEVLSLIGSGGMGRVYMATDRRLDRSVVVKSPRPDLLARSEVRQRFIREIQNLTRLEHPNVVNIYDTGEHDGLPFAVMPHLRGGSLRDRYLASESGMAPEEVVPWLRTIADALDFIHANGCLHRDVKPDNILFDERGHVFLSDFGISTALAGADEMGVSDGPSDLTRAGHFVGNPSYVAPEAVDRRFTPAYDQYSLAVVVYEALTGRLPFVAPQGQELTAKLVGRPTPISEYTSSLPVRLAAAVMRGLAREPDRRFDSCSELAAIVADEASPARQDLSTVAHPVSPEGERRHITVMFCDMVGSTTIAEALDPEDLHELMRAYHADCAAAVEKYAGHIAKYLGDGALVYFGYPYAQEDAGERAARASLEILERAQRLDERTHRELGVRVQVRIGIHSGFVVIGDHPEGATPELMGHAVNVAARLQTIAEPDTAVLSESTRRLLSGNVETETLGARELKGLSAPVEVHRIVRVEPRRPRFHTDQGRLSALVGRQQELDLLLSRWELAKEGRGQVVMVSGEAGIGKSRVLFELRQRIGPAPHLWLQGHGGAQLRNSPFQPVIEILEDLLELPADAPGAARLRRVEELLADGPIDPAEAVPLLADLLSLPPSERYPAVALSPDAKRRNTLALLLRTVSLLADRQPIVVAVEDLHWVDASTLELLGALIEEAAHSRLLLLLSYRPEFQPPWMNRSHILPLTIGPLSRQHVQELVEQMAIDSEALPPELASELATRTDGVPLFAEELARSVLESERTPAGAASEIPATLQDVLMARLDNLGEEKDLAQLAAVVGRRFPHGLLEAIAPREPESLGHALDRLIEGDFLYRRGFPPDAEYVFKHALIHEAAYGSLVRGSRRRHHRRVAEVLLEQFPQMVENKPEVLAHHYTGAGLVREAIPQWLLAGRVATARSAHHEAVGHLRAGLDLLPELPPGRERDEQELILQVALGTPLAATRGYASPDVAAVFARAEEISDETSESEEFLQSIWGLCLFRLNRGDLSTSLELAERLLAIGNRSGDASQRMAAHFAIAARSFFAGDLQATVENSERLLDLRAGADPRAQIAVYGQDFGATGPPVAAISQWILGYPDRARATSRQAIERGRASDHPYSLGAALAYGCWLEKLRGDVEEARRLAEEAVTRASEQGFTLWLGMGTLIAAWAHAESGATDEGLADLDLALSRLAETGQEVGTAAILAQVAEVYLAGNRAQEALGLVDTAIAMGQGKAERLWHAELQRVKGEVLLRIDPDAADQPVELFRAALSEARGRGAKTFELRAATSLARLWRQGDRRSEGRGVLAAVYERFDEGFQTRDLMEARRLLQDAG